MINLSLLSTKIILEISAKKDFHNIRIYLVCVKENLGEGQDKVEYEPDIHHLDVGGFW